MSAGQQIVCNCKLMHHGGHVKSVQSVEIRQLHRYLESPSPQRVQPPRAPAAQQRHAEAPEVTERRQLGTHIPRRL